MFMNKDIDIWVRRNEKHWVTYLVIFELMTHSNGYFESERVHCYSFKSY